MTHRQRALAALRGQPVDRLPFIGRMELWFDHAKAHDTLPPRYANATLWDLQRDLDIGIYAHVPMGGASFYRWRHRRVTVEETRRGGEQVLVYHTPHGVLRSRFVLAQPLGGSEIQPMQVEYPFRSPADYDALAFLLDDLEPAETFDGYHAAVGSVGEDGLAMPQTGYVPMHRLAHTYFGYETFYLELYDHPAQVERLHDILWAKMIEVVKLAAQSPADAVAVGGNYDESMTPPPFFGRWCAPFHHEAHAILSAAGKPVTTHGDGEMRKLLTGLRDCGVDGVEAVTPQPMTSIDLRALRELWRDRVTIWGGIASIVLTPTFSEAAFEAHLDEVLQVAGGGDRYILGFGDNVPTDGIWERVERVAGRAR
ncbi:MAG: hypothetical protein HYU66_25530 [Armatimonadetes bacterium]|nr:hypothetical protein [Armatimonadota bacterium]